MARDTATRAACPACGRLGQLPANGRTRKHASPGDPGTPCPGSGQYPAGSLEAAQTRHEGMLKEWEKTVSQGAAEGRDPAVVARAEATFAAADARLRPAPAVTPGEAARLTSNARLNVPPPWAAVGPAPPSPAEFFAAAPKRASKAEAVPMSDLGAQIAARLKETFYQYVNRDSADNRGAQAHMGPSEIGTPCDRRIALKLLGAPAVNPGGDGWPAFVGTQVHRGLADMFEWANHGTGRYATEQAVTYPYGFMPRGTADLVDRTLLMVVDHKIQGASSASHLRERGPSDTYRIQLHVYARGLVAAGETVEHVALVSWPRDRSTLANLHVWTEPYDEQVAINATRRVESIASRVGPWGAESSWEQAARFATADDCRYCPFHLPGASPDRACRGHQTGDQS